MAKEKPATKICKHCKTEIPYEAKVCPQCQKKQGWILKWVIIIMVAIVIISAASSGDNKQNQENESTSHISSQTEQEKPTQSKKGESDQKEEEQKEEKKDKYNVGDTWKNKYVLVSYDKCGEYISDNQFIQPSDGKKYLYATFTFENVGKSDTTVGYWDFDCYADGYACEGVYLVDDAAFTQTLSPGRKITGSVYFEVPDNAAEIEFEYSPSFWTSEKIVFVYE